MRLLDVERRSISLRPRAHERAVRQVGRPDLRAGQVVNVFKVQIVPAVVEHVDHLMGQHALHDSLVPRNVLANDDLVQHRIVPTADADVTHLARNVPPDVDCAKRWKHLQNLLKLTKTKPNLPPGTLQRSHHQLHHRAVLDALVHVPFALNLVQVFGSLHAEQYPAPAGFIFFAAPFRI